MKPSAKSMRHTMVPDFASGSPPTLWTTFRTALPTLGCSIQILPNALNPSSWTGPTNSLPLRFLRTSNSKDHGLLSATANTPFITKQTGQPFPRSFQNSSYVPQTGLVIVKAYLNSFHLMVRLEWPAKSAQSQPRWPHTQRVNSPTAYTKSAKAN